MEIEFEDSQLEKLVLNRAKAYKKYGAKAADTLYRRLSNIQNIVDESELSKLPGDFHQLKYDMSGLWACSITKSLRLVMKVEHNTAIIIEVVNYHKNK